MREARTECVRRHEHGLRAADDNGVELRADTTTQLSRQCVDEGPHADSLTCRASSKQVEQYVVERPFATRPLTNRGIEREEVKRPTHVRQQLTVLVGPVHLSLIHI